MDTIYDDCLELQRGQVILRKHKKRKTIKMEAMVFVKTQKQVSSTGKRYIVYKGSRIEES